jgi:hypothetical protein
MKCEVEYNIREQTLDVYLFDNLNWYVYNPDAVGNTLTIPKNEKNIFTDGDVRYLAIPYEAVEELEEAMAKKYASRKGVDISLFENTAKDSHIKDLKWILTHFINKDK